MNTYNLMNNVKSFGTADHIIGLPYGYDAHYSEMSSDDLIEEIEINAAYEGIERRDLDSRPKWNFF